MQRSRSVPARLLRGLTDLDQPPGQLYCRGELPAGPVVALVGTRKPSSKGYEFAEQFAFDLTKAGAMVASGGAAGIDTAAHRGALSAGGATWLVAPCGLDRPFPADNAPLYEEILASGGGLVTEHADPTPAKPSFFFRRNAVLAAISLVVVVVQAPLQSGARNAAKWARRLGRPLFAVPASPWDGYGGANTELRMGAALATSAKDVLKHLERNSAGLVPPSLEEPPETGWQLPLIE